MGVRTQKRGRVVRNLIFWACGGLITPLQSWAVCVQTKLAPCSQGFFKHYGGEVAEWLKAVDSKSTVPLWYRGFESHPLRSSRWCCACWCHGKGGRARWGGSGAL